MLIRVLLDPSTSARLRNSCRLLKKNKWKKNKHVTATTITALFLKMDYNDHFQENKHENKR